MTDWRVVGRRIQARREALGLTQEALGRQLGATSANYVAQVERGLAVSERKLAEYAAVLGLSLPYLRYGISAAAGDVAAARLEGRAEGRAEGRNDALSELAAWLARTSGEQAPGQYRFTLRRVGEEELAAAEREVAASLPRAAKTTAKKGTKARQTRRAGGT